MGQKDLTQKNLEDYPDVFADLVNALLYEGKTVLSPGELQSAPTETFYYSKGNYLRNQFHDVSKYVMKNGIVKVQYTLENEIRSSNKMLLRKVGYEGAVYRGQYEKKVDIIYPVISLVLHWGKRRWKSSRDLQEFFQKKKVPEMLVKYIDNIKLHVYDMRCLSSDVRRRFTSDMRIVVDYLAEGETYKPTKQQILHVEAFLLMKKAVSGDIRYEQMISKLDKTEEGEITMCGLLDKYEARGIEKGIEKGVEKGESLLAKLMENLFKDNRMSDAKLVLTDIEVRKQLYEEYGIC